MVKICPKRVVGWRHGDSWLCSSTEFWLTRKKMFTIFVSSCCLFPRLLLEFWRINPLRNAYALDTAGTRYISYFGETNPSPGFCLSPCFPLHQTRPIFSGGVSVVAALLAWPQRGTSHDWAPIRTSNTFQQSFVGYWIVLIIYIYIDVSPHHPKQCTCIHIYLSIYVYIYYVYTCIYVCV